MTPKFIAYFCLLTFYPLSANSATVLSQADCDQTKNVQFDTNDIFNLDDPDTIFIHYWANFFHIKTKEVTLLNESAFFLQKCEVNLADIAELERHLRKQKYIREAKVSTQENGKVKVETWDNWSLMPTVDFGRKGGTNKYAIGIKDRNLLGLGIDAEIEYFSNNQRTGYKLDTQFPLFLNQNLSATIRLSSNDDGSSQAVFLQKEFVSFDTGHAYKVGFDNYKQIDSQFQNGETVSQYNHDKSYSLAQWQWLAKDTATDTLRYGIGYIREKHNFTNLISTDLPSQSFVPEDRKFQYPFVSVEYLQKDYLKLSNFNLINQIEDFNLGWHISVLLGRDFSQSLQTPDAIWHSSVSKGVQTSASGYLFFDANFSGEWRSNQSAKDRLLLTFSTEYFHKFNESWGAYFKNANTLSRNAFLDDPVALGDDSGVRGYPLQYQHGERMSQFTAEARYYPHINIYKLFELGGAAFLDTGKAFGDSPVLNVNHSLLTSVGLGLRFFSTHSSDKKIIHLDVVKPISTDVSVNGVEIRITTKQSF